MFRRGIGESSEVVGKEMYEFEDRGGRILALRPEGTAPMVRAFVQHRPPLPWKAWYVTPAFRYERPQAGRYRQHHQLGVEALGPGDPDLDVEVVVPGRTASSARPRPAPTSSCGSTRWATGCAGRATWSCCASSWPSDGDELCPEHRDRDLEANPLRVLDCKRDECRAATEDAPRPGRPPLRPVPRPLRPGAWPASTPSGWPTDRPPPGPGLRLLHADHLRVRLRRPGVGPERDRRRRPLRRPGGDAGRPAHAGHRVRHRHRAGAAGLRRRGGVRRRRPSPSTPSWSTCRR